MSGKRSVSIVVLTVLVTTGAHGDTEAVSLETIREMVAHNESLLNPIKMAYTVKKTRTGERPQATGGKRVGGRSYSHFNCVWAQDGEKHYAREDFYYGPDELARSTVKVFGPERVIEGRLPDLANGTIKRRDSHDWYSILVAKLGLRPFEGDYTLSEVLIPDYASVRKEIEMIDGREAYVVDARRPSVHLYFARIWVDKQRGIPLQIWYYDKHPNWSDAKVMSRISGIKHHRLPNGAWVPIEGVRSIHFSDDYNSYEHITVNVDSIKTQREDIPASLFQIEFPDGARIYDALTCLTSVKGKPLRDYQQVVSAGGSYIAGVVVDEEGLPVSQVVVSPFCIKTKQDNGRFGLRLIQPHERTCAVTDPQGRFAVELEEDGLYELWFCPREHVDIRKPEIPLGEHNLRITLGKGGTITGRVVRITKGKKVPVPNAEVNAKEPERVRFTTVRSNRLWARTDSQGRFQIRHLETLTPDRGASTSQPPQYVPLAWQISCGSVIRTVRFESGKETQDVELVPEPDLNQAILLIGRTLPDFEGIKIDVPGNRTKDKMMLVCFFDMDQRPSRNCLTQLTKQAQTLGQQGIILTAVQAVKVDEDALGKWVEDEGIPFPVGMIQDNEKYVRFDWAVCSLPWLVLTDRNHIVRAEGFAYSELNDRVHEVRYGKY